MRRETAVSSGTVTNPHASNSAWSRAWCLHLHLGVLALVLLKELGAMFALFRGAGDGGERQHPSDEESGAAEGVPGVNLHNILQQTAAAAAGNCRLADDSSTVCYVHHDDGSPPRLLRDLALALATVLATCAALALYNYHIHRRVAAATRQAAARRDPAPAGRPSRARAAALARVDGTRAAGDFLSAILAGLWDHAREAVADALKDAVEPALRGLRVPLHFTKIDLGDMPIKTTNMFIHRVDLESANVGRGGTHRQAGIQIDVDVEWDGNCDIWLQATLTNSAKLVFGVEHIKVKGRMHVLLGPLSNEMPVISAVQYGFHNPPTVVLNFTGAVKSVASLSFVQAALAAVIQSSLAAVAVLPNRMVLPMDLGSYDYFETYKPPLGMVRLRVMSGRGFRVLQKMILKDIPDVYCLLTLGANRSEAPPFRTSTRYNDLAPSWRDEGRDFILYDMDQKVYVEAFDEDQGPLDPDDELGKAEVSVRDLFRQDGTGEVELELRGEKTGCFITMEADLFHLSERLQSLGSPSYAGKDRLCGLVTVIVTRAFDVPVPKKDGVTYVKVVYGEKSKHEKVFYTGVVVDNPGNPVYDSVFQVPITAAMLQQDKAEKSASSQSAVAPVGDTSESSKPRKVSVTGSGQKDDTHGNDISFTLIEGDGANDTIVVTYADLLNAYKHTVTGTRCVGDTGAKLEFRVILSGMQSETEKLAFPSSHSLDIPLDGQASVYGGIEESNMNVRVTVVRGRGFQIKKRRIGKTSDVPDVYCNIDLISQAPQSSVAWKTSMIKDDTMPRWNEARTYSDVNLAKDKVRVEAYDQNSMNRDECLGAAEFSLELLLRKRLMELELFDQATGTGSYVTLMCVRLHDENAPDGGNKVPGEITDTGNVRNDSNEFVTNDNNEFVTNENNESVFSGNNKFVTSDSNEFVSNDNNEFVTSDNNIALTNDCNAVVAKNDNVLEQPPRAGSTVGDNHYEEEDGDVLPPLKTKSVDYLSSRPTSPSVDNDDESVKSFGSISSTSSKSTISRQMRRIKPKKLKPKKLGKKLGKMLGKKKSL